MVLQDLVDHHGRFTNINVGWSGKVHEARSFRNSGLFSGMSKGTFASQTTREINGVVIPPVTLEAED